MCKMSRDTAKVSLLSYVSGNVRFQMQESLFITAHMYIYIYIYIYTYICLYLCVCVYAHAYAKYLTRPNVGLIGCSSERAPRAATSAWCDTQDKTPWAQVGASSQAAGSNQAACFFLLIC